MSVSKQMILILCSILLCYLWISIDQLAYFSLQLAAVLLLVYFIVKKVSGSKIWHVAPDELSIEMAIFTTSVLLLTASTGNMDSLFFPISYIHVFFLAMTLRPINAVLATFGILLFHFAVTPLLTPQHISTLISLPIMLTVFLFTKKQYDERKKEEYKVWIEDLKLSAQQTSIGLFLNSFLTPKLEALSHFSLYPEANKETIQKQIHLIQMEIKKVLEELHSDQKKDA